MNTHIEHDLVLAVVSHLRGAWHRPGRPDVPGRLPGDQPLLAAQEAAIRRSFLDDVERAVDDRLAPVAHLVGSWSIERARTPPCSTHARVGLRRTPALRSAYLDGLARTVGMGSRLLLAPAGSGCRVAYEAPDQRAQAVVDLLLPEADVVGRPADHHAHVVLLAVRPPPARRPRRAPARGSRRLPPARAGSSALPATLARTVMFAKPPLRTSSTRSGTSAIS